MKFFPFFIIGLLFLSSTLKANRLSDELTSPDPGKNLFVLKTDKKFMGATVEVFGSDGVMITAQHLQKRKVVIDFQDAQLDTYTIVVSKGDHVKEFKYRKK